MIEHYWKARLVKGAPYVGVRTFFAGPLVGGEYLDRSPRWQAQVRLETSGRMILMGDECPIEIDVLGESRIMLRNVQRIEEKEYRYLIEHAEYATKHRPDMPDASPTTPIDWMKKSLPF